MRRLIAGVALASLVALGMASPASAASKKNQRFVITTVNDKSWVTASGAITGVGTDKELDDEHAVFSFKNGSVNVRHVDSSSKESFNHSTCVATFSGKGDYWLTGGTGSYRGVSGSGTYRYSGKFVGVKTSSGCDEDEGNLIVTVHARGTTILAH